MARASEPSKSQAKQRASIDEAIKKALTRSMAEHELGPRMTIMDKAAPKLSIWRQQISGLWGHVTHREVLDFCRRLGLLLDCGMPMVAALNTLTMRTSNRSLAAVIREIGMAVEGGSSFTDAVSRHSRYFSGVTVSMIRAGEVSGKLIEALYRVADQGEKLRAARSRLLVSLIYPALILVVAIAIILFVFSFLMGHFQEFIQDSDAKLPALMAVLLKLGAAIRDWRQWVVWVGVLIVLGVGYVIGLRFAGFRLLRDRLRLRLPLLRHFAKASLAARFSRIFSMLLSSGVPLLEALLSTREAIANEMMRLTIDRMRESIHQGGQLAPVLENADVFPPIVCDMVAIGEEAGALDRVFGKVADAYEMQLETDMAALAAVAKPMLVLAAAGVVVVIAAAFFSFYASLLATAMGSA